MHKRLVCKATLLTFFVWNQFISTVNIRGNLHFETSPVILFQDGVFDNTEGLLTVQGRGSTQNHNSTKHWQQSKNQGCLVVFSSISLSISR